MHGEAAARGGARIAALPRSDAGRGPELLHVTLLKLFDLHRAPGEWLPAVIAARIGEACAMLTAAPGPDVAPYHGRQIAVVPRAAWRSWLDGSAPSAALLRPSPAGTLTVARA